MITTYSSFKTDIKNLKFTSESGQVYKKTAIITFEVPGRTRSIIEVMGYMDEEEIYSLLDQGKPIVLDQCYIYRFSLKVYRELRKKEAREPIEVNGFRARNAFFDSSYPFDFSHAIFSEGDFDIRGSQFNRGALMFDGAVFDCKSISFHDVRFANYSFDFKSVKVRNANVEFTNSVFGDGDKDFQDTHFGDGDLLFTNAEFNGGDVNFINCDFGDGEISFKVARFGEGNVELHYAKFGNAKISFERTNFGPGTTDFRTVEFGSGRVNFNRSEFGDGEVTFEATEMKGGKFSFKRAKFGTGPVSFEEAVFKDMDVSFERTEFGKGNISFYRSNFGTLSFRFCHLDDYLDLRMHTCREIDLSDSIVRDIIDLNPYEFSLNVKLVRFSGMRLIGRIYINWKENGVKELIHGQEDCSHRLLAEQFRILKENFSQCGQYNDEDHSYVEFKRHEAKANLEEQLKTHKLNFLWSYPAYYFKKVLFDHAGKYATSPVRVLGTSIVVYVLFSIIYEVLILTTDSDIISSVDDALSPVARSFYHSAITFLTIGYGDHFPYHAIRWVSAVEGFAGLFLMSYFTVAFVRKVLR